MRYKVILLALLCFYLNCSTTQSSAAFTIAGKWTIDKELSMVALLARDNIDFYQLTDEEKKRYLKILDDEIINFEHYFYSDDTYKVIINTARYAKEIIEGTYKLEKKENSTYLLTFTEYDKNDQEDDKITLTVKVHDNNSIELIKDGNSTQFYKRIE